MEPMLLVKNIVAGYQNRPVLHNVSLSAFHGESVLLIGPNGCGKTTLLKTLAGTLRASEGHVTFQGKDVSAWHTERRVRAGLGYLMQTRNIFPSLTVEENLDLSAWGENGNYEERHQWVLSMFPMLKDRLDRRAGFLSGGERQALAIGMVLMRPAKMLLLDEPTAGLSPKAATMVLEALHAAQAAAKFTSLIVEHNLRLVHQWVTRVVVMNQGRVVGEEADPSALLSPEKLQRYYFG